MWLGEPTINVDWDLKNQQQFSDTFFVGTLRVNAYVIIVFNLSILFEQAI